MALNMHKYFSKCLKYLGSFKIEKNREKRCTENEKISRVL